jgi:iron donor protein CyaY
MPRNAEDYTGQILIVDQLLQPAIMTAFPLSDSEYHQLATGFWMPESQIDQWLDQDVVDIDTHRTGGLLELSFENGSKMVLNTQPPLQEIWLAAKGGGYHFATRRALGGHAGWRRALRQLVSARFGPGRARAGLSGALSRRRAPAGLSGTSRGCPSSHPLSEDGEDALRRSAR